MAPSGENWCVWLFPPPKKTTAGQWLDTIDIPKGESCSKSYDLPSVFHGVSWIFVGHGLFKCFFFCNFLLSTLFRSNFEVEELQNNSVMFKKANKKLIVPWGDIHIYIYNIYNIYVYISIFDGGMDVWAMKNREINWQPRNLQRRSTPDFTGRRWPLNGVNG